MPAQRSRTANWRLCLTQLHERGGSLEIAVHRGDSPLPPPNGHDDSAETSAPQPAGHHLVWRVALLVVGEHDMVVEQPCALGRTLELDAGIELIALMTIGQNRWMFRTTNLGAVEHRQGDRRVTRGLRLSLPQTIERCQRRHSYRVETATLSMPPVDIWPLLDPQSVLLAERANELQFEMHELGGETVAGRPPAPMTLLDEDMLPQVGPRFAARLVNIGGGGIGLRVRPDGAGTLHHHKLFWLRFTLAPDLVTPICVTAKLVHAHLEAGQDTYAGMAFDFTFNPAHHRFVLDQICRYISIQQRNQLRRQSA